MLTALGWIPHKIGHYKRYNLYSGDYEDWGTGNDRESNQASSEYEPPECWCDLCMHQDEEETYTFSSELRNNIVRHPWFVQEQPGASAGSQSLSLPNVKRFTLMHFR